MIETDKKPLVSVIIPAYHAEKFISRALVSIRNQTLKDLEILVVIDDANFDKTVDICIALLSGCDYNLLVQSGKTSPANARNRAIAVARGKYLAFLDADDEWRPDHVRSAVDCFGQAPTAQVYYAKCVNFSDGVPVSIHGLPFDRVEEDCPAPFSTIVCVNPPPVLFDECLKAADDWKWLLEMHARGVEVKFNPVIESYYHMHGGNLTSGAKDWAMQELMVRWRMRDLRRAIPLIPAAIKARFM